MYSKLVKIIKPSLFLIATILTACGSGNTSPQQNSCVIIDNDYDIDDMMAIPLVIGNKHVAAIIQSEGYTLPESSAPAINQLVNNLPDQPNQRKIPIIVGGSQTQPPDLNQWPWLQFFRSMMNLSNGLLTSLPTSIASSSYPNQVADAVMSCKSVSVLIIGTYTSFINYSPLIKNKIDKVVIMGEKIGDDSRTPAKDSFNCRYDLPACQQAMGQLESLNTFFVDIPRFDDCHDTASPPSHCYNPTYQMVAGNNGTGGLIDTGLPGRLKQALMNNIQCASFYTTPDTIGNPCSSLSTWVPADVYTGPGGEMLLWDETAALFLLHPELFSLYYPTDPNIQGGLHYEPTLVNESYGQTIQMLRSVWTQDANQANNFQ